MADTGGLGRRVPTDFEHIDKYPLRALALPTPQTVERLLKLPSWHWTHNQGDEGACVGFGGAMMKAILDGKRFNPWWLWDRSKMIDEWPETVPGDDQGTSVRASCEVMRAAGMVPLKTTGVQPAYSRTIHTKVGDMASGIKTYRWATTVDQMRAGLAAGVPISIGVNWYAGFDAPTTRNNEQYIFIGKTRPRGGHCVCVYGASDSRQAFRVKNSWGRSYPLVWLPYTTMARLLNEQGEAALVTDR